MSNYYLAHHGIKGQKWGVRRFQNADGSLTSAGRSRYGVVGKRMQKDQNEAYKRYKRYGLSDEKAFQLSEEKKELLKKVAIGTGIAVGSAALIAAAYYGMPYVQRNIIGITIKAGQTLQTLSDDPDRIQNGADFYAAFRKRDKERYKSRWGKVTWGPFVAGNKYKIEAEATKNLKIASRNQGSKIANELIKNNEDFKKYAIESLNLSGSRRAYANHGELAKLIKNDPSKIYNLSPKEQKMVFESMNFLQVNHDPRAQTLVDALKQKGFAGMVDINDSKLLGGSRFNTNAVILFNGNTDIVQKSVSKLSDVEINNARVIDKYIEIADKNIYKIPGVVALATAPVSAITSAAYDENVRRKEKGG